MPQEYRTVSQSACVELVEKRSRFIGYVQPVSCEEDALAFLDEIRQRHWDAKHNVYAYRLRDGGRSRYSDDGEPQGTAGMPVLEVLSKQEITDCIVVVTRYFGGILLGTGGLVRAYSQSAAMALDAAGIVTMRPCTICHLACDYPLYGRLAAMVPEWGGLIDGTVFEDRVQMEFRLPDDAVAAFERALADATGGSVGLKEIGKGYF